MTLAEIDAISGKETRRMIQPTTPIAVTLTAERWEQVLRILDETPAPHRITHPLITEIQTQCMRYDTEQQQRFPPPHVVPEDAALGAAE